MRRLRACTPIWSSEPGARPDLTAVETFRAGVYWSSDAKGTVMTYKIAIIVGSLRKDSLNRKVARSICALRGENLDCCQKLPLKMRFSPAPIHRGGVVAPLLRMTWWS